MQKDKESMIREQVDRLGRPSAAQLDRECARLERQASYLKLVRIVLLSLVAAAAAIVLITNTWIAVLQVDGSGMNPLLQMGDIIVAVRGGNPAKNDVTAFYCNNKLLIRRVVAVAGDMVSIDSGGAVSVNGSKLDEPYAAQPCLGTCDLEFPFHVPAGTVFVLGDNRPNSLDSRSSQFGPVPREQLVGKVAFRVWPLRGMGRLR